MRLRELIPLEEILRVAFQHKRTKKVLIGKPGGIHADLAPPLDGSEKLDKAFDKFHADHHDGFATDQGEFIKRKDALPYAKKHKLLGKIAKTKDDNYFKGQGGLHSYNLPEENK